MNYYNENDPKAAAWLSRLIAEGYLPHGTVDTRSIEDARPIDLVGTTKDRRQRIDSDVHPTWQGAYDELLRRANRDVKAYSESLQKARSWLGQVEKMKP